MSAPGSGPEGGKDEVEARRLAEERLAEHPDREDRLQRLRRRVGSLDAPSERALVYLREAAELGPSLDDHLVASFGDDVAAAFSLLLRSAEESDADVLLRSIQHPLARAVVSNDVGEELDRLASAAGGTGSGPRWDFLILSQALLDRADGGDESREAQPVSRDLGSHTTTVYLHPVHGDIVVLVRPGDGGPEQWLLIDKQQKDQLLLEMINDRLSDPLESGLVPWLRERGIRHHLYSSDEGDGTALA